MVVLEVLILFQLQNDKTEREFMNTLVSNYVQFFILQLMLFTTERCCVTTSICVKSQKFIASLKTLLECAHVTA